MSFKLGSHWTITGQFFFFLFNKRIKIINSQVRIQTTTTFALANLEIFCQWKIGETLWKIGEILDKIGKPGHFKDVHFFPVSAPDSYQIMIVQVIDMLKNFSMFWDVNQRCIGYVVENHFLFIVFPIFVEFQIDGSVALIRE